MRDPKRIKKLLGMIEEEWNKHPDQRFYQLLTNMGLYNKELPDHYWIEDDEMIKTWESNDEGV